MGFIYGKYYKMAKIYKIKMEMTMPSLQTFWYVCSTCFSLDIF